MAGASGDASGFRIAITSITRGRTPAELLYSLETDEVSGIFAVDGQRLEQRLFHTADFRVRHIALDGNGTSVAAAIFHRNFASNIAILGVDGNEYSEITEGDSIDLAPRWVPGPGRRIVFQSAGLGRDAHGRMCGLGPFAVEQIDIESGGMETLAEDRAYDFLAPLKTPDGSLYYIRRPYRGRGPAINPVNALKDTLLFPFRLSLAVFQYFNFFSMRYTGKPLATSRGAVQRHPDLRQMMIWGNLVEPASHADRDGDPDAPALVPASWQLMRRTVSGSTEELAQKVLSFDIARDGSIVYSNGSAIYHIAPSGGRPERILVGSMIEQVTAL